MSRITLTNNASHCLAGFDHAYQTHFETLDLASRGIAVRLQTTRGPRRYMIVAGISDHLEAYQFARENAPIDAD